MHDRAPVSAMRSKNVRHAPKSSSAAMPRLEPEQAEERALDPAALLRVGDVLRDGFGDLVPRRGLIVGLDQAARPRTISPSAQKLMPVAVRGRAAVVPADVLDRGRRGT